MNAPLVRHGDQTTTGGFVIALSSTMFEDGKHIALHGDEATCGNCKGLFKVFGTGDGISENNRVAVIHGDKVLCPCGRNRVIASGDAMCFLTLTSEQGSTMNSVMKNSAPVVRSAPVQYDEQFTLTDNAGRKLAGVRYQVCVGPVVIASGITDSRGCTRRISTDDPQRLSLQIA
ncbi:PAAR domain-containing protein [Burkholderia sp. 22PA0106]|uniref:PAAR domain-containing protein n=1 Tax=Burkholderia sp. 22PA0106 TaxID=3237371 RepID=UPI0039C215BA